MKLEIRSIEPEYPFVSNPSAFVMRHKGRGAGEIVEVYPSVDREIAAAEIVGGIIRHFYHRARAIKAKGLGDLAGREGRAVLECAVVAALDIDGIAITRPPTHHIRWRRSAGPALARAARIIDGLHLRGGEGAIEDFNFIDQPIEESRSLIARANS